MTKKKLFLNILKSVDLSYEELNELLISLLDDDIQLLSGEKLLNIKGTKLDFLSKEKLKFVVKYYYSNKWFINIGLRYSENNNLYISIDDDGGMYLIAYITTLFLTAIAITIFIICLVK